MEFKQIKELSTLPDEELTAKLVALFQDIAAYHDAGKGMSHFDWNNLYADGSGALHLSGIDETELTDDVRERNLRDYAGIIYCVSTQRKSSESMSWDAGAKIKQPVLREIVLTLCSRNNSIEPLLKKLRQPYVDEDEFFHGYTTVDEKEANEAYIKAERIRAENAYQDTVSQSASSRSKWYKGIGVFILMALCSGGYKYYKSMKEQEQAIATERIHQQMEEMRLHREAIRNMPPLKLTPRSVMRGEVSESNDNDTINQD